MDDPFVIDNTCVDGLVKVVKRLLEVIDSALGSVTSGLNIGEDGSEANKNNEDLHLI